jgi:transposase
MRKRHRYGALICDLETHRPLDLLPDRSADTLAAWLQAHPQITVISRDRGGAFAEGARRGAPQAMQVADRFHLLQNLSTSVQTVFGRIAAPIQAALRDWRLAMHDQETAPLERTSGHPPSTSVTERRTHRRTQRHDQFDRLAALGEAGWSQTEIARELGVSKRTVQRWQSHPRLRTRSPRTRTGSILDRYRAFILAQWQTGCQSGAALYRALQAQGYQGSYRLVTCYLAQLFPAATTPQRREPASRQQPPVLPAWTPHALAWLCLRDPATLTDDDTAILAIVQTAHPEGATLYRQIQAFRQLVRTRPPDGLNGWMADIDAHGCPELQRFVQGLRRDEDAVQAGLREQWSNGQTEGHIHRLKLLKRSMYGRAKLDLLRIRLLAG